MPKVRFYLKTVRFLILEKNLNRDKHLGKNYTYSKERWENNAYALKKNFSLRVTIVSHRQLRCKELKSSLLLLAPC